jgi:DNA-binding IclR family transcriptional regulator
MNEARTGSAHAELTLDIGATERGEAILKIVDAAFDVLLTLAHSGKETGVRELARSVGIPKSSAARIVHTLRRRGFLLQNDETSQYRLGPRILEIAAGYQRSVELRMLALPEMSALAAATKESAFLALLDNASVLILDRVDGQNALRMMTDPGAREPLYCTGLGKVLLAGLPEAEREALLAKLTLEPKTERTITSLDALRAQVAMVASQGYALDNQEFQEGTSCIAVPVRAYGGAVVAAISISGPSFRIAPPRAAGLVDLVSAAGQAISHKAGYEVEKTDALLFLDSD